MKSREKAIETGIVNVLGDIDSRLEDLMYMEPDSRPQSLLDMIHHIADKNVSYLGVVGGSLLKREKDHYKVLKQFGETPSMRTGSFKRARSMPLSKLEEPSVLYRYNKADIPIPRFLKNNTLIGFGKGLDYIIMLKQKTHFRHHEPAEAMLCHLANICNIVIKKGTKYQGVKRTKQEQSGILDAAHLIQQTILPKEVPKYGGCDIYALSIPAKNVGGDYYTFSSQKNYLMITLADVVGHGLPASLHCRTLHTLLNVLTDQRPETIVKTVNDRLIEGQEGGAFTTLFYCELSKEGNLAYINAGHHPPYLLRNGRFRKINANTLPLGKDKNLDIQVLNAHMVKEDTLIIYSDGIIEQLNSKGDQFGVRRFLGSVRKYSELNAEQIAGGLYKDLQTYSGGKKTFADDVTVIVVKKL